MKGAIETQSAINIFSLVKHIWINIHIGLRPSPNPSMLQLSYSVCFKNLQILRFLVSPSSGKKCKYKWLTQDITVPKIFLKHRECSFSPIAYSASPPPKNVYSERHKYDKIQRTAIPVLCNWQQWGFSINLQGSKFKSDQRKQFFTQHLMGAGNSVSQNVQKSRIWQKPKVENMN